MIDQILSALKLSIAEVDKLESPVEYIFELNQVLNRYKTNLFKLLPNKERLEHDAKEFIQIRISTSWRQELVHGHRVNVTEESPVMLMINGFIPQLSGKLNKEITFNKAIDITDIINLDKLRTIKTDHHTGFAMGDPRYMSEEDIIKSVVGDQYAWMNLYMNVDKSFDGCINFSMQLAGHVYYSVVQENFENLSKLLAGSEPSKFSNKKKTVKSHELYKDGMKDLPDQTELVQNEQTEVIEKVQPVFRSKNNLHLLASAGKDDDQVIYNGVKMSRRFARQLSGNTSALPPSNVGVPGGSTQLRNKGRQSTVTKRR